MTNVSRLYFQTLPFTLARFLLALFFALLCGLLLLLFLPLEDSLGVTLASWVSDTAGEDLGSDGPLAAVLFLWLGGVLILRFLVMYYAGYLLKAAHIAVLSEILATGGVPSGQMAFGKKAVRERFGTTHAFIALDRILDAAVSQLCRGIDKLETALEGVPGVAFLSAFIQLFLRIALGHVDECCLAMTFRRKSGKAFADAADSVVLFFQNWTTLLGVAVKTTIWACVAYFITGIVALFVFGVTLDFFETEWLPPFLGVFFFWTIKMSFIDNWIMTVMLRNFFAVAKDQRPQLDLYGKLASVSDKFNDLWKGRADAEQRTEK